MEQVTFVIDDKKDANLLIAIADKLRIKKQVVSRATKTRKKNKSKNLFKIINASVDVSNFGDPSLWQRETRKDRSLINGENDTNRLQYADLFRV